MCTFLTNAAWLIGSDGCYFWTLAQLPAGEVCAPAALLRHHWRGGLGELKPLRTAHEHLSDLSVLLVQALKDLVFRFLRQTAAARSAFRPRNLASLVVL